MARHQTVDEIPDEIEFRGCVYFRDGPARECPVLAKMEASMHRSWNNKNAVTRGFNVVGSGVRYGVYTRRRGQY